MKLKLHNDLTELKTVLVITYYWPPAGGAGVQRWLKMSKYLPEFGIEPIILTVDPGFASYPVKDESLPGEVAANMRVIRTKSFEPLQIYSRIFGHKNVPYSGFANVETESLFSKLSRWVRGNFFIPDARKGWNKYALAAARKLLKEESIETVITTGPPHSTHLIGQKLKKEFEINWVADFRDPWTDIYYYDKLMHGPRAKRLDRRYESVVLRKSDLVFSVCPSNQKVLRSKLSEKLKDKVVLLPNGFDESDFTDRESPANEVFTMAYTGTMAAGYNFNPLFQALSKLKMEWKLIIAGSISPEVAQELEKLNLAQKVDFRGYVDHDEVLKILTRADLLLHVLPKGEKGTTGKLFEYIGSGKPILNLGPKKGDSAFYIDDANAGKTFSDQEIDEMVEFMGKASTKKVENDSVRLLHSRRARAKLLMEFVDQLSE